MTDFEELVIDKFLQEYNVNLKNTKEIEIEKVKYPNYGNLTFLTLFSNYGYSMFEYCRIINKIYGFNYKHNKLSYYETFDCKIEPNDIVFDCGANTGIYSIYASSKGKQVYSFEPSTATRHYLRNSQKYNNKINIIPFGLSNEIIEKAFAQTDNPGAARTLDCNVPECHKTLYTEKVKLITLDDFVSKTNIIPNFIKMDIENGELQAIQGSLEIIKKYKPKLSISIHNDNLNNVEYLKSLLSEYYNIYLKEEEYYDLLLICSPKR